MAREIVTSENRKEYMEKKLGTPMSEREAPVHMGNWMKKYKENEDKNFHTENVVRVANLAGHVPHHEEALGILKRHNESDTGISQKDYKRRNEIDKELYPHVEAMYKEWLKSNK